MLINPTEEIEYLENELEENEVIVAQLSAEEDAGTDLSELDLRALEYYEDLVDLQMKYLDDIESMEDTPETIEIAPE